MKDLFGVYTETLDNPNIWIRKNYDKIKELYPNLKDIYGPYINSEDGRLRIVLYFNDLSKKTRTFSKLKMEIKSNKRLHIDETVAHLDNNFNNNSIDNLEIIERRKHISLDILRRKRVEAICIWCNKSFILSKDQMHTKLKSGPFCSRKCTGKYGSHIQNGGNKINREIYKIEYYRLSDKAGVGKLVNPSDLKSDDESLTGSSPVTCTKLKDFF